MHYSRFALKARQNVNPVGSSTPLMGVVVFPRAA